MASARTWRRIHRYLGLVIGVQLLLWTASGLVFSWNAIESVRGETRIRHPDPMDLRRAGLTDNFFLNEFESAGADDARVTQVTLRSIIDRPVVELTLERAGEVTYRLVDPMTGQELSPIAPGWAAEIAQHDFFEPVEVELVELIESVGAHSEYRNKETPAYRVVLKHPSQTTIYVSANRGVVTARRNQQWRLFDFFWMLHTMDYAGRDNFNSWILRVVSVFGLMTVVTGFILWSVTSRFVRRLLRGGPQRHVSTGT